MTTAQTNIETALIAAGISREAIESRPDGTVVATDSEDGYHAIIYPYYGGWAWTTYTVLADADTGETSPIPDTTTHSTDVDDMAAKVAHWLGA